MTLTQDELRQLYEAGCPFVEYRFDTYRGSDGLFHKKDEQWELNDTIVNARFTIEAALVGYATQLLDGVWPNEHRSIHRCKDGSCYYTNIKWDNYPSLTAMIVDLARMKKERVVEKLERCAHCSIELPSELRSYGYCGPRCEMLASANKGQAPAPESVTAPAYDWSVRERQELDKQLNQLRDVIEWLICDLHRNGNINIDAAPMLDRLRKVVENNAAKEKV